MELYAEQVVKAREILHTSLPATADQDREDGGKAKNDRP